jgi:hypothetical protein
MLDVFCCALGCVTLLWLDKTRQAAISAEESEKVSMELTETQQSLFDATHENLQLNAHIDEVSDQLALARKDRDALARQLALVREERDKTAKNLAVAEDQVKATAAELLEAKEKIDVAAKATRATTAELIAAKKKIEEAAQSSTKLRSQVAAAEEELQKKQKDLESLTRKITKAQTETEELQILLREREQLQAASAKAATAASEKAAALEKKYADAEKRVDSLSRGQTRITELEKELNRDNAMIVDLQGEKAKLADKLNKIQIESEQKFAGIAMTGKRVVFLVDMSGSMDRTDYDTLDATKWPTVRETLIKIMRSLPDLEKFQIIVFSSRANFLIGSGSDWLTYEKEKSMDLVRKTLATVKPVGDTNMYAALDEAFRFRDRGLDTIYLLSDGLPTSGPGLAPSEEKLSETERGNLLGKYIRKVLHTSWNRPRQGQPRVRINSVGFFYESPDVGAFLWALSRENDGSFVGMSKP